MGRTVAVAAASGAASVRVWHITSRGWDPWTERPLTEVVRVAYPPLDETLKGVDVLLKRVDADVVPDLRRALESAGATLKSADATLKSADATLKSADTALSSESPLQSDLRQTLVELNRAVAAIRALANTLDRYSESLIRGKPSPPSP